jgi:hypothetical protein
VEEDGRFNREGVVLFAVRACLEVRLVPCSVRRLLREDRRTDRRDEGER